MKREILFRAKAMSGEWVYGSVIYSEMFKGYSNECRIHESLAGIKHDVIPETLGQYIGSTDKNDKKVFQGDILRTIHFEIKNETFYLYHVVEWSEKFNGWFLRNIGNLKDDSYKGGDVPFWVYKNHNEFEVIGNIYDNTELLK